MIVAAAGEAGQRWQGEQLVKKHRWLVDRKDDPAVGRAVVFGMDLEAAKEDLAEAQVLWADVLPRNMPPPLCEVLDGLFPVADEYARALAAVVFELRQQVAPASVPLGETGQLIDSERCAQMRQGVGGLELVEE